MTLASSAPRAEDLRLWMLCHVQALERAGAASWHRLRAQMILDGFDAFLGAPDVIVHKTGALGPTEILLNPIAAAALHRELELDEIADELVQLLFTNGQGNQAARLELVDSDGRGVGGWGPGPVRDRVLEALRKATPPAPAVLEAIQDEEAILRLAHAFRALGRAVEWDESPTVHDVAGKLADYLENPAAARQAIELADDRNRRTRRTR